jgi:hypothetical protein
MYETINIEEKVENKKSPENIFKDSLVDLDKHLKPLDVMIYYGVDERGKKVPAMTRGEFSCIVAKSKTKKSFNKTLIESAFVGGKTNNYTDLIVGNRKKDNYIISIDTEQGEFYAQKSFGRVERITGFRYDKYLPLQMRKKSIQERLEMIEWLIYESEYKGKIDFLFIDGIADLVYNTNDIEEGVKIGERLLKWTADGNLHISTIIHKAGNTDKARGHLGTAIQIKAETIILMDALTDDQGNVIDNNTVIVRCGMSRGKNFEPFYLSVDNEGLPFTHRDAKRKEHPSDVYEIPTGNLKDAFENNDNDDGIPF